MSTELTTFNFEITSLQQAMDYAKLIADSDLAPKDYKGRPGNVLIAIQCGMEIGLKPMQAIQNIAIINGRPAVWGDAMLGLVISHPLCEYVQERIENDVAYCTVKRRGEDEYTYKFSRADAKVAGLLGKAGPWTQYPERMMQMRARGFALRDKFADVLKGIALREEVEDYEILPSKQERQSEAKAKVQNLLEGKKEPLYRFEEVKAVIDDARHLDDLIPVVRMALELSEDDKSEIRVLYRNKENELKEVQTE